MKEELDTRFLNRLMYIGGTIILVSILAFLFNYLGLFSWTIKIFIAISPVFIAIFISFLMEPVIGFLISKGMRRNIAVIITYLLLIGIIALFFYITVPSLINQIENLINNIP
ncbi:TPA: AI-2E family transporter, partial [bacterium]|nr:AI-2E family transporter [bacterium]